MKIGAFTVARGDVPFAEALDAFAAAGIEAVEVPVGNYAKPVHCDPDALATSAAARDDFLGAIHERGLALSALSCHGNPLHPRAAVAEAHQATWRRTLRIAQALGVENVVTFAGLPGADATATVPAWIVYDWPEDTGAALRRQWEDAALPWWREELRVAADHGVHACVEPHPNTLVHNPATFLRLRDGVGAARAAHLAMNFDPSHFFWQRIDPAAAIRHLHRAGALIRHVHAKDTRLDPKIAPVDGVVDPRNHDARGPRAWRFCVPGDGHDESVWRDIIAALRETGYDGALSIEHEDPAVPPVEGFARAAAFLRRVTGA